MRSFIILTCACLVVAAASGCVTQKTDVEPAQEILGGTAVRGKGIPNGRSDTNERFIRLDQTATDSSYGFARDNPVKVGGVGEGPSREMAYLNALRGPAGQPVEYERLGSCCRFETPNGILGVGFLDVFRVTYEGQPAPARIYINMYDEGPLLVPVGFTARQPGRQAAVGRGQVSHYGIL